MEFSEGMNATEEHMNNVIQEYQDLQSIKRKELSKEENEILQNNLSVYGQAILYFQDWIRELDIRRRVIPLLSENDNEIVQPKSWKDKVALFLSSKGFVTSISTTNRFIANVGLGLLMVSFVSMTGKSVSSQIMTDSALIYEIQLAEQNKDFNAKINALVEEVETEEWTEEDERTADDLSKIFESNYFQAFSNYSNTFNAAEAFHTNSGAVRENIIQDFATTSEGRARDGFDFEKQGDNWKATSEGDDIAKKWTEHYAKNVQSDGPVTDAGRQFKSNLRTQAKRNPHKWASVKSNVSSFVGDFSKPAKFSNVAEMVMGELFEESVDGLVPETNAFGDLTKKMGKSYVKNYTKNKIDKATLEVFTNPESVKNAEAIFNRSSSADDFFASAVKSNEWNFSLVKENIAEIRTNYPTALNYNDIDAQGLKVSKASVEELATALNVEKATIAEAVSDFKYHFPGQIASEAKTISGELLNVVDGIGTVAEGVSHLSAKAPSFRARSFNSLRGFRRIGGVLIGQKPLNPKNTLQFDNISWVAAGADKYAIFLHRADGKKIPAGIFEKDIIHQALIYAADGRPISTTMISAKPIPYLKILVHPALVNTELGCQSIGLDRLVDKYAINKIQDNLDAASLQDALYKYVVFQILNDNGQESTRIDSVIIEYESMMRSQWSKAFRLLEGGNIFLSGDKSHLVAKPEYFNKTVVTELRTALKSSNGNFDHFKKSISNFCLVFKNNPEAVPDSLLKVQTEQWSGVRERNFKIDSDLSFLKNPNPYDKLYPLEFMRQVVFVPNYSSDEYEEVDKNPWEFPVLKKNGTITMAVSQGILSDKKDVYLVERMRSFTQIQRVFRLAFEGYLGYQFPVSKLKQLAKETRSSVVKVDTPTWNVNLPLKYEKEYIGSMDMASQASLINLMKSQKVRAPKNLDPCN